MPQHVIPGSLKGEINRGVDFSQVRQDPGRFRGVTVVLGGEVVGARNLAEGTEIEALQVPLDEGDRPTDDPVTTAARFLLLDPGRSDPAVLQGRRITVVGEVAGWKDITGGDRPYAVPYMAARFVRVWLNEGDGLQGAPYADPGGGPSHPYFPVRGARGY